MRLVNNVNVIADGVMDARPGYAMPVSIVPSFGVMSVAVSGLSGYRTRTVSVDSFGYEDKCMDVAVDWPCLDVHQRSQRWGQPCQDWRGFEAKYEEQPNSEQKADKADFNGLNDSCMSSRRVMRSGPSGSPAREGRVGADVMGR